MTDDRSEGRPIFVDAEMEETLAIARRASEIILRVYATAFSVEMKGPGDPVTLADKEANEQICDALAKAFPGDAVLAEESAPTDADSIHRLASSPRVWFVDPLDGTREFADRNGEFAVMIGLCEAGRATMGVVVQPTTGEAMVGRVGHGAFLEAKDGSRAPLVARGPARLEDAVLIASRSHRPAILEPFMKLLGLTRVVACGSVGVKVARVATGVANLYVHGGRGAKRWDTCAPEAILVAAGGAFTDLDGAPITYASRELAIENGIIATTSELHASAVAAVRRAR